MGCNCVACRMRELLLADHRRLSRRIADTLFQRRGALSGVVLTCGRLRVHKIYKPLALTVNLKCARLSGRTRPRLGGQSARRANIFRQMARFAFWDLHRSKVLTRLQSIRGVGESFVSPVDGVRTSIGL